jgi:hypothetical protein
MRRIWRSCGSSCGRTVSDAEEPAVDLVVINESSTSYLRDLQAAIESLARAGSALSQAAAAIR